MLNFTNYFYDAFTDVNECLNPDSCKYGTCINTNGKYICQCPPNFTLTPTGTACIGIEIKYLF